MIVSLTAYCDKLQFGFCCMLKKKSLIIQLKGLFKPRVVNCLVKDSYYNVSVRFFFIQVIKSLMYTIDLFFGCIFQKWNLTNVIDFLYLMKKFKLRHALHIYKYQTFSTIYINAMHEIKRQTNILFFTFRHVNSPITNALT